MIMSSPQPLGGECWRGPPQRNAAWHVVFRLFTLTCFLSRLATITTEIQVHRGKNVKENILCLRKICVDTVVRCAVIPVDVGCHVVLSLLQQVGLGFRNEISPREGLLRVREFCMAEASCQTMGSRERGS